MYGPQLNHGWGCMPWMVIRHEKKASRSGARRTSKSGAKRAPRNKAERDAKVDGGRDEKESVGSRAREDLGGFLVPYSSWRLMEPGAQRPCLVKIQHVILRRGPSRSIPRFLGLSLL